MKSRLAFVLILLSAFLIRIFGINWDQGFHLHPDERMLIMVADRISFFKNLNPDFFNYGSLPIYLLKGFSQIVDFLFHKNLANYSGMLQIGRGLSVLFDLITICIIYKIGQLLFKSNKAALFSSLIYGISFFPIQNSHFFVVDVLLNTFITGLIYTLLIYFKSPSVKKTAFIGILFAAMMATKFTSIIFYPIVISILIFKSWKKWRNLFSGLLIFHFSFLSFYFLFMPYAFIEHIKFISDIKAQLAMNSNPYVFPYTLQYVGTVPYLYYLKNIFLWGLGPIISILSILGLYQILKIKKNLSFLFLISYLLYFLVIGRSAVKFMRYMLPLYPLFVLFAGYGLYKIYEFFKPLAYIFLMSALLWTYMFLNIYSFPHTRIAATDWILKSIPEGSTLAVEHWDDRVPTYGGEKYNYQELTLYDQPDDINKWKIIDEKLQKSDYIIIASNRLYVPLQKLVDCEKYKVCYLKTAEYYQKLFSNKLHFKKVAEFSSYPKLEIGPPIGGWKLEIRDDVADESFTVYDHPKILIFKKSE
jgi:hypothetical protein